MCLKKLWESERPFLLSANFRFISIFKFIYWFQFSIYFYFQTFPCSCESEWCEIPSIGRFLPHQNPPQPPNDRKSNFSQCIVLPIYFIFMFFLVFFVFYLFFILFCAQTLRQFIARSLPFLLSRKATQQMALAQHETARLRAETVAVFPFLERVFEWIPNLNQHLCSCCCQ